jgi:hypothetical protein
MEDATLATSNSPRFPTLREALRGLPKRAGRSRDVAAVSPCRLDRHATGRKGPACSPNSIASIFEARPSSTAYLAICSSFRPSRSRVPRGPRTVAGRAVQAAFTALPSVLTPLLCLGDKPQDRPMTV